MLNKFEPTICKNVLDPTVQDIMEKLSKNRQIVDLCWASPMCTQYSKLKTQGAPRDLVGADALVQKALDLVKYFDVPFFMENPHTGLLKK